MPNVCFYFQVHQPERLRRYRALDVGCSRQYFDSVTRDTLRQVAARCWNPMGELLLRLIDRHAGAFKATLAVSGTALDQLEENAPETIALFQRLVATGCVEVLAESYFHSLAFVYDRDEHDHQVALHHARVEALIGVRPVSAPGLPVLLESYRLTGGDAPQFASCPWEGRALAADDLARWISRLHGERSVAHLFMDYDTFAEHQWTPNGVLELVDRLPAALLANPDNRFTTPREAAATLPPAGAIDLQDFTTWSDVERGLSPWLGNAMQQGAASDLYGLRDAAHGSGDPILLRDWQRLTASDHLHCMCTRWFSDGDARGRSNPWESPYEAYLAFMNVLNDLTLRLTGGEQAGARIAEPHLFTRSVVPLPVQQLH